MHAMATAWKDDALPINSQPLSMDTNVFQQQQNNLVLAAAAPPAYAQEAEAQPCANAPEEEVQPHMANAPEPAGPSYLTLDDFCLENFSPIFSANAIPEQSEPISNLNGTDSYDWSTLYNELQSPPPSNT